MDLRDETMLELKSVLNQNMTKSWRYRVIWAQVRETKHRREFEPPEPPGPPNWAWAELVECCRTKKYNAEGLKRIEAILAEWQPPVWVNTEAEEGACIPRKGGV